VPIELIKMTLNHGVYTTRTLSSPNEVIAALTEWRPHLVLLDMDPDGARMMDMLTATPVACGCRSSG
jgi:DNA-binding NtrC family response regulator